MDIYVIKTRFDIITLPKVLRGSSAGKESACNAGDPGSIPGSGRSPGERIGYPLHHSWLPWWLRQ